MAKRQITEKVMVPMSYDEYKVWDALSQELNIPVPQLLLRMASIGVIQYVNQTTSHY
ncbi:hypothetical protein Pve01_72510 [Planomonospora venezuelensis]|nr:hypothetical protein Pve01_72510 [Planomonospora venezuelensis]